MKRLRSTETLGATSAALLDKTGTLTLSQDDPRSTALFGGVAVSIAAPTSTEGQIKHVAGEPEVPLEQFMFPLVLACDAVLTPTGEMIGGADRGALVVLGEKGGLDIDATR